MGGGLLDFWLGGFPELVTDPAASEEVSEFVRGKIRARIQDPVLAEKLVPYSYGFGTYRVPLETGYYDVFNRDNVELVDVRQTPISGFTENGLVVGGREYELDVVVLATGFDAGTGALTRMDVHGRAGRSLSDLWHRDIRSASGSRSTVFPTCLPWPGRSRPPPPFAT